MAVEMPHAGINRKMGKEEEDTDAEACTTVYGAQQSNNFPQAATVSLYKCNAYFSCSFQHGKAPPLQYREMVSLMRPLSRVDLSAAIACDDE